VIVKLLGQAVLVAVLGVLFGLGANALSPRGLALGRNYFPGGEAPPLKPVPAHVPLGSTNATTTNTPGAAAESLVFERLRSKGLHPATLAEVQQLHSDPRFALDQIVFLDDRDHEYAEGHVPGAFQFFHYRAPDFLPTLLPVLLAADKIVVYCGGGSCEDSEFAALMLAELGIPKEKLMVFAGGMKEWKAHDLPLELGERRSGRLAPPAK
jgi:rhodanese-related sulfurtransferase